MILLYSDFKPQPQISIQVYRFNPDTGAVRVATDLVNKPNGLTFSPDFKHVYMFVFGLLPPSHPSFVLTIRHV